MSRAPGRGDGGGDTTRHGRVGHGPMRRTMPATAAPSSARGRAAVPTFPGHACAARLRLAGGALGLAHALHASTAGAQDQPARPDSAAGVRVAGDGAATAATAAARRGPLPPHSTARNVAVLLGVGSAAFAVTWVLPEELSKWDKSRPMSYYLRRSYTRPPVWDRDPLIWNWVVHPIAGQQVYLMERNHGRSPVRGFLLATAASVGWEYGFEAFIERPSIQDLLITSPVGSVLGELTHRLTRRLRRNGFGAGERVVLTLVNPTYVLQYGYRD